MKDIAFPVHPTKVPGAAQRFHLSDPAERAKYFHHKVGPELVALRTYLSTKTFVAYLLGKKNSGKGTYSKLFQEAVGGDHVGHVAIGDIVRDTHAGLSSPEHRSALVDFLQKNYRGFHTIDELIDGIEGRSTEKLVSTELIVALLKYEISRRPRQAIFIDGFPRGLDQIPHSMFLKELIGYRDDPDFLVFIDLPEAIIDERIKYRVVCPICKTPRNLKLLATNEVGFDAATNAYYLKCDTPTCNRTRMVAKEGDALGIEPIRVRLETDDAIFRQLLKLHGLPKVYLRNSVPVETAVTAVDDYEITPAYEYGRDEAAGRILVKEKPWVVKDDAGVPSYSLLPPAVVVSLIKQVVNILGLTSR